MLDATIQIKGLYTNVNQFSVPDGSLRSCKNVDISQFGNIESRKGFQKISDPCPSPIKKIFEFEDNIHAFSTNNSLRKLTGSSWGTSLGTFPMTGYRAISKGNGNVLFNTDAGVKAYDGVSVNDAGAPQALTGWAVLSAGSFLAQNTKVVYRVLFGYRNAQGVKFLGSPSGRFGITNTGSVSGVTVTTALPPSAADTKFFMQVYRSPVTPIANTPTDDLFFIGEIQIDSTAILSGVVNFVDNIPDTQTGALLYTSPSVGSIDLSNDPPPICADFAIYRNRMWYAGIKRFPSVTFSLSSRLVNGNTITIGSTSGTEVYTARASVNETNNEFQFFNTSNFRDDIENTASSICRLINRKSTRVWAFYLSSTFDSPGVIYLYSKTSQVFYVLSSTPTNYSPNLPTTTSTVPQVEGKAEDVPGLLFFSNLQEFESAPLLNSLSIGNRFSPILRISSINDALIVFKTDGIFMVTGTDPSTFQVQTVAPNSILQSKESVCVLENRCFALLQDGIYQISDTGLNQVGLQVADVSERLSKAGENFFAVSNAAMRKVLFWGDKQSRVSEALVFHTNYQEWTIWEKLAVHGIQNNEGVLVIADSSFVYKQRNDGTINDYSEESYSVNITKVEDGWVYFSGIVDAIKEGAIIEQSNAFGFVLEFDLYLVRARIENPKFLNVGTATVFQPITWEASVGYMDAGNPGFMKQFISTNILMKDKWFNEIEIGFSSSFSPTIGNYFKANSPYKKAFGQNAFGGYSFGAGAFSDDEWAIRALFPKRHSRALWIAINLRCQSAKSNPGLSGIMIKYNRVSEIIKNALKG